MAYCHWPRVVPSYSKKRAFIFNKTVRWTGNPLVSKVSSVNSYNLMRACGYMSCFPKEFTKELKFGSVPVELCHTHTYMLSSGVEKEEREITSSVLKILGNISVQPKFVFVDGQPGGDRKLKDSCKKLRDEFPELIITAGNVSNPNTAYELVYSCGANIVDIQNENCVYAVQTSGGLVMADSFLLQISSDFIMYDFEKNPLEEE